METITLQGGISSTTDERLPDSSGFDGWGLGLIAYMFLAVFAVISVADYVNTVTKPLVFAPIVLGFLGFMIKLHRDSWSDTLTLDEASGVVRINSKDREVAIPLNSIEAADLVTRPNGDDLKHTLELYYGGQELKFRPTPADSLNSKDQLEQARLVAALLRRYQKPEASGPRDYWYRPENAKALYSRRSQLKPEPARTNPLVAQYANTPISIFFSVILTGAAVLALGGAHPEIRVSGLPGSLLLLALSVPGYICLYEMYRLSRIKSRGRVLSGVIQNVESEGDLRRLKLTYKVDLPGRSEVLEQALDTPELRNLPREGDRIKLLYLDGVGFATL